MKAAEVGLLCGCLPKGLRLDLNTHARFLRASDNRESGLTNILLDAITEYKSFLAYLKPRKDTPTQLALSVKKQFEKKS